MAGTILPTLLFGFLPFAISENLVLDIVLKPRDWMDPTTADNFLCGIDSNNDFSRLLAEMNTAYIFSFLDKSQPTVFDVVAFDSNDLPHQMLNETPHCPMKTDNETGLGSLFLAPKRHQCNSRSFDDAMDTNLDYFPVFISSSGDFTEAITRFISEAQILKPFFNNEIPKMCGTWLKMEIETARAREKELKFLFNFIYNNYVRSFDATKWKTCKTVMDTVNSIDKSELFATTGNFVFKERNPSVNEYDGFARISVLRSSPLDKKAVVFVQTDMSGNVGKCPKATVDDIVPLFNAVVFNEKEKEADVLLIVKQDAEEEEDECVLILVQQASMVQRQKRRKRMLGMDQTLLRIFNTKVCRSFTSCANPNPVCRFSFWVLGYCVPCDVPNNLCQDWANNKVCANGDCVQCSSPSDCAAEQTCDNNLCIAKQCEQSKPCPDDEVCTQNFMCVPCDETIECSTGRVCQDGRCIEECDDNDITMHCRGGTVCDQQTNICRDCTEDNECRDGLQKCQKNRCTQRGCMNEDDIQCYKRVITLVEDEATCEDHCRDTNYGPCTIQDFQSSWYNTDTFMCTLYSTEQDQTRCNQNRCQPCNTDTQCAHFSHFPACSSTAGNKGCRKCTEENTKLCTDPDKTFCDIEYNSCQECSKDEHCNGQVVTPKCLRQLDPPESNKCVQCLTKQDCRNNNKKQCYITEEEEKTNFCVECLTNPDCSGVRGRPLCNIRKDCVQCTTDNQCKSNPRLPRCYNQEVCVRCLSHADCNTDATRPFCQPEGHELAHTCAAMPVNQCNAMENVTPCNDRFPGTPSCQEEQGCVRCTTDEHCTDIQFSTDHHQHFTRCHIPGYNCYSQLLCEAFWWKGDDVNEPQPELGIYVRINGVLHDRAHLHINVFPTITPRSSKCARTIGQAKHANGFPNHLQDIVVRCRQNLNQGQTWTSGSFFPTLANQAKQRTTLFDYDEPLDGCFFID